MLSRLLGRTLCAAAVMLLLEIQSAPLGTALPAQAATDAASQIPQVQDCASSFGPITLSITAEKVTGSWVQGEGMVGKVTDGFYNGSNYDLAFEYNQDWNGATGLALFASTDGKHWTGQWEHMAGMTGSGTWEINC